MRYLSLLCLLFILACNNLDPAIQSVIDLEKAVQSDDSKKGALLSAYQTYANTHPEDSKWTPEFILKGAKMALADNSIQQAIPMLTKLLSRYGNSAVASDGLATMADLYAGKLKLPAFAKPLYEKLSSTDSGNNAASDFLAANAGAPEIDGFLDALKARFIDTLSGNIDRIAIRDFQRGVAVRGITKKDDKTIDWLLSGGETARMVKNNQGAIDFYDWVLADYGDLPKASQALFLKAFTYDNELNQDDTAKPLYEKFLAQYPDNDFADDAKFLLQNLGKSDEEIIQSFQKPGESE